MAAVYLFIIFSIVMGVLNCLYGKKLYFIFVPFFIAIEVYSVIIKKDVVDQEIKGILIFILVYVVMMLVFRFFFKAAAFLMGALVGMLLGSALMMIIPENIISQSYYGIVMAIAALVVAIASVKWSDLFVIIATSYSGAVQVTTFLMFLIINIKTISDFVSNDNASQTIANINDYVNGPFNEQYGIIIFLISIVIAVLSFIYQKKKNI